MAEQRLPIVNSDDGTWGDILRQYLLKEHYDDGTDNPVNGGHKTITIRAGTASAGTAPLKFTSGTLLSSAEAGAMEFNNDSLYFTITTGTTRKKVAIYDDSSGATGDLYYRDSSGRFVRLGIGSDGQALVANSGLPTWDNVASSAFTTDATSSTSYIMDGTNTVIFANAGSNNVTVTLPHAASSAGYRFYIKRTDGSANTVTVQRDGATSDTIDGQTSVSLDVQYMTITVVSDGSNWYII